MRVLEADALELANGQAYNLHCPTQTHWGKNMKRKIVTTLLKMILVVFFWLAPGIVNAQNLRVILLGTGTPQPRMDRFGPSILVQAGDENLLFDSGRGAAQRLSQLQIPFGKVTRLFLTHLHSDHVVGIPDLWLTGWVYGREIPLQVWGPAGTQEMMSHLEKAYQFDIHIRRDIDEKIPAQGAAVIAKDIKEGVVYEQNGVKVTAFNVDHGPVKPALGYRIDYAGRSVVLSGDTRFSENLIRFSNGAQLLIHEVIASDAFRAAAQARGRTPEQIQSVIEHHTTPEQTGEIFTRVKPKLAVYSHISGDVKAEELTAATRKTYSGPLEVGEDLMVIQVGEEIQVRRPAARVMP